MDGQTFKAGFALHSSQMMWPSRHWKQREISREKDSREINMETKKGGVDRADEATKAKEV